MKKLNEMKIAKEAILSELESSILIGGRPRVGDYTSYYGPDNPSSLFTYVDGAPWGEDGTSGSLFGDSWACSLEHTEGVGTLEIQRES